MGKYYTKKTQQPPVAQYSPYNIEFIQGQMDKSQARHDSANIAQAQAFAALNEVDTDANDQIRKDQLIAKLHERYNDIDLRNNGDLAAASGEITNFIGTSRQDKFWKRNEYAVKEREAFEAEKAKLGENALVGKDPSSAWDNDNKILRSKEDIRYSIMPKSNWTKNVNDIILGLTADSIDPSTGDAIMDNATGKIFNDWRAAMASGKLPTNSNFIQYALAHGISEDKVSSLYNNPSVRKAFIDNTPSFRYAHEKGANGYQQTANEEDLSNSAGEFIKGVITSSIFYNQRTSVAGIPRKSSTNIHIGPNDKPIVEPSIGVNTFVKSKQYDKLKENVVIYKNSIWKGFDKAFQLNSIDEIEEVNKSLTKKEQEDYAKLVETDAASLLPNLGKFLFGPIVKSDNDVYEGRRKDQIKILRKAKPLFETLSKLISGYVYNGKNSKGDLIAIQKAKKAFDVGMKGAYVGLENVSKNFALRSLSRGTDVDFLKESASTFEMFKKNHKELYEAELNKPGATNESAYINGVKRLESHVNSMSEIGATTELYTGKTRRPVTEALSRAVSNALKGAGKSGFVNSKVVDANGVPIPGTNGKLIGTDFNPDEVIGNGLGIDFLQGTFTFTGKDKNNNLKFYTIDGDDLKETVNDAYKIFKVPSMIFKTAMDPTSNGYGMVHFKNSEIYKKDVDARFMLTGYKVEQSKKDNSTGAIVKKITLYGPDNKPIGTPMEGTPQQLTTEIKKYFGEAYFKILSDVLKEK